jgi:hypothetical protein
MDTSKDNDERKYPDPIDDHDQAAGETDKHLTTVEFELFSQVHLAYRPI